MNNSKVISECAEKMDTLSNFRSWLRKDCEGKEMLCHFYYQTKSQKKRKQKGQLNSVDFAYFNLFNPISKWLIKGTTGHGIDKTSEVPVLNCYKINDKFTKALKQPQEIWTADYEIGLILDQERLCQGCETYLQEVQIRKFGDTKQKSLPTWCLDDGRYRRGALDPFNQCDVVRLKILRNRQIPVPVKLLDEEIVKAILVKRGAKQAIKKLLADKDWNDCKVFPLLPNYQLNL